MEKKVFAICCLLFVVQNVFSQSNINQCNTPNSRNGVCINIKRCQKLKIMLETQRNNATVVAFLRKSSCGYEGKDPKVCCQLEDVNTEPITSTQPPSTQKTGFIGSSGYETISSSKLPTQKNCGRQIGLYDRITGGKPAELGAWPWMAAIGYQNRNTPSSNNYQWLCGGSLLSDRYVITAAHCTTGLGSLILTVVRLGELDLDPNVNDDAKPIDILISHIIRHEQYNAQIYTNDIALLKLKTVVTFNDLIQPICLPTYSEIRSHKLTEYKPYVCGWGTTSFQGPTSTRLLQVQLPVIDNADCKKAFINKKSVIDDKVLCAGDMKGVKDSCQGDSGGPLMLPSGSQYYLVGIVSYGYRCAEKGYPGVYTRTTTFLNWIVQNINNS